MTSKSSTIWHFVFMQASTLASLSLTILAYKRALEPLYASVPTHNYLQHAVLAASIFGSFFTVSYGKAAAIYGILLAIAPHTTYWVSLYSARWRDLVLGPAITHIVALAPLISAGMLLLHSDQSSQSTVLRFLRLPFYYVLFPSINLIWDSIPIMSFISSTDIFFTLSATIIVAASATDLTISPGSRPKSTKKSTTVQSRRIFSCFFVYVIFMGLSFSYTSTLHSRFRGIAPEPHIDRTKTVKILSSTQSITGVIVVGEVLAKPAGSRQTYPTSVRYLRAAHSLLGGAWIDDMAVVEDSSFAMFDVQGTRLGDPIYAAFVLQEAVRLVDSTGRGADWTNSDALIIGLGTGVAPASLQRHGINTTIVEIDPAVYSAARTYFGLPDPGEGNVYLEDARGWIAKRREAIHNEQERLFDIVIHDCFSGGSVPAHIFTLEFWKELLDVLKPDGIVAVNFAGKPGSRATRAVLSTLLAAFNQCRAFFDSTEVLSEEQLKAEFLNMVFFCTPSLPSTEPLTFRRARKDDYLGSYIREFILGSLEKREIDLRMILDSKSTSRLQTAVLTDETNPLREWQKEEATLHWKMMRDVFPDAFWETF